MTHAQLKRICATWQKRLRPLHGWRISIRFGDAEEMKDGEQFLYGRVEFEREMMTAEVMVRHPNDMGALKPYPVEETVVHELLHLIWLMDEETAINLMSEALLTAYKRYKK
jgi:hypothetical protein